jgi:3-oxoacyl-(acyl-carrier-protein) synthase
MLAVTGTGLVSSLGLDAPSSCAAARAGLRRIVELDALHAMDDDEELAPVSGHQVPLIASGFFGFARLVELSVGALRDLQRSMPDLAEGRLGIVMLVGASVYKDADFKLMRAASGEDPEGVDADEAQFKEFDQRITNALLQTVLKRSGLRAVPALTATLRGTCVGIVSALEKAQEWLRAGACDRCIVGAVDSLVDANVLDVLDRLGLLRTLGRAVGILPGEAASFHALDLPDSAAARRRGCRTIIRAPMLAAGSANPRLIPQPIERRETLATAISEAIAMVYAGQFAGTVLTNLNGDEHRAQAWGATLARLRASHDLGELATWFPCLSFGDVGAAVGCVSIAMVAQSWARPAPPPPRALVCLLDDVGGRAVIPICGKVG